MEKSKIKHKLHPINPHLFMMISVIFYLNLLFDDMITLNDMIM